MKKFYNLVISWMISLKRDFDLNIEEYGTDRLCASYFFFFFFWCLPGTLFIYFVTIFILGDGLTRLLLRWFLLLLRWEKSAPLLSCSWTFLGCTKGGVPGGIRTRGCRTAARRTNHSSPTH